MDFWLCIALQQTQEFVQVQWMNKIKDAMYEMTEFKDEITQDSVICKGIEMKYMWTYHNDDETNVGVWKLVTSESTIATLHEEKYLIANDFKGLPFKMTYIRNVDTQYNIN